MTTDAPPAVLWTEPVPAEPYDRDLLALCEALNMKVLGYYRALTTVAVRALAREEGGVALLRLCRTPSEGLFFECSSTLPGGRSFLRVQADVIAALSQLSDAGPDAADASDSWADRFTRPAAARLDLAAVHDLYLLAHQVRRDVRAAARRSGTGDAAHSVASALLAADAMTRLARTRHGAARRQFPVPRSPGELNSAHQRVLSIEPLIRRWVSTTPRLPRLHLAAVRTQDLPDLASLVEAAWEEILLTAALPRKGKKTRRVAAVRRLSAALDAYVWVALASTNRDPDVDVVTGAAIARAMPGPSSPHPRDEPGPASPAGTARQRRSHRGSTG